MLTGSYLLTEWSPDLITSLRSNLTAGPYTTSSACPTKNDFSPVEHLLDRMHKMGSNMERSNLHLKLFKLVLGSVSLFAAKGEPMLMPHLHQILNNSMELAITAEEPHNHLLLLQALFRSIGSGGHNLLYQEFLHLLPNLLQGLNSLQSGLHM